MIFEILTICNCLIEAVKHENYTMPFGTYKPYFHGELVTEYRNSLSKIKAQSNGDATVNHNGNLEVYEEPGKCILLSVKLTNTEVCDDEKDVVRWHKILNLNEFLLARCFFF